MSNLRETFKNRLSQALEERGAQRELVRQGGASRATLTRWLSGERAPDLDQVQELAKALGKDPIDLLFPGELPRAPAPEPKETILGFTELFAEIAKTEQGRKMLAAAVFAVLGNVRAGRAADISRPKEK